MQNLFRRYDFFNRSNNEKIGFCYSRNRAHAVDTFANMVDVDLYYSQGIYCVDNTHMYDGYFEFTGEKNEVSNSTK